MAKISFEVDTKNLNNILTILKSLKSGMIKNLKIDESKKFLNTQDKHSTLTSTSKYLSKDEFKQRLKKGLK
ncbi:hypothetical protein AMRN_0834 [Malaciobacter marinus]|uniref:Uncharacterized protein n=1 Tax=Malaciobacter marinus TaxID=505249 RepID=A0A347TJ08_9BACT|nr:hypothetical protein [Malaciobacter marinus]AXX86586.1 hypothetical protein AMRN_0834 [Malaciobacter marinus]PHO16426.1 hypothetical protein CPH92_01790 [Malaciobacter marinus]